MNKVNYQNAHFLTSAAQLSQLPKDEGAEVAFVGRSNTGKSSALNVLTQQKRLAFTSKTPGRTQLINFFEIDEDHRLVDLPGYGYAKVPMNIKKRWEQTLTDYLLARQSLKGLVMLMDIRRSSTEYDFNMLELAARAHLPVHVLLTKADKLKFGAQKQSLLETKQKISKAYQNTTIQLFSAIKYQGVDELRTRLNEWIAI